MQLRHESTVELCHEQIFVVNRLCIELWIKLIYSQLCTQIIQLPCEYGENPVYKLRDNLDLSGCNFSFLHNIGAADCFHFMTIMI